MTEATTRPVAWVEDVPPGSLLEVTVEGEPVLLANAGGRIFAVAGMCTHEDAPLADGYVEDESVVCPWHFSRFCLRTGAVLEDPAVTPLGCRPVHVSGGAIFVG